MKDTHYICPGEVMLLNTGNTIGLDESGSTMTQIILAVKEIELHCLPFLFLSYRTQ
jgi:hypothetical protein